MIVHNGGNRVHTLHALLILVIDGTIYKVCLHASNTLKFYRLVMGTKMNTGFVVKGTGFAVYGCG